MFILEFEEWSTYWPLIFRPNELDKDRNTGLSAKDLNTVGSHMSLVSVETAKLKEMGYMYSGGVIVNPDNNIVISTTTQVLEYLIAKHGPIVLTHPLQTPTFLCVEGIAAVIREELPGYGGSSLPGCPLISDDPYLCTGLHLYLDQEPDLMSAMSLVHSRIGKVFFREPSPDQGALFSCVQLHSLPALNHHFRVYQVS
jgi:tRNA(Arg) A34 adenosine deaminase TadA